MRIILDTNILINAQQGGDFNYGNRIMQWVINGELEAVVSPQTRREHEMILQRELTRPKEKEQLRKFLRACREVRVNEHVRVVADDPEDDKFFSLAKKAGADVIITNDHHLLDIGQFENTEVLPPDEFIARFEAERDPQGQGRWAEWMKDLMNK